VSIDGPSYYNQAVSEKIFHCPRLRLSLVSRTGSQNCPGTSVWNYRIRRGRAAHVCAAEVFLVSEESAHRLREVLARAAFVILWFLIVIVFGALQQ